MIQSIRRKRINIQWIELVFTYTEKVTEKIKSLKKQINC